MLNEQELIKNNRILNTKTHIAELISENINHVIKQDQSTTVPLFLRIKPGFIENLTKKIINNPEKSIVIGVAGESASGKTTLARNTVKTCLSDNKELYTVIAGDDYFHDWSKELAEAGSFKALFERGYNFDVPDAINLDLMREHIIQLTEGYTIRSPKYDFVTCASIADGEIKKPAKVILTEGLFSLNPKLRNILDIAIYVHTPHEVIKERWYKRAASRGKTPQDMDAQFSIVSKEAQKHIRPTMQTADIIVNGLTSGEYIEFIADKIINAIKDAI